MDKKLSRVKSFVRRLGRITPSQQRALDLLWDRYGLRLDQGRMDWKQVFGGQANRVLDIGFGNGDALLAQAASNPWINFVGIEVHKPGVGRLLAEMDKQHLDNIRVFCDDAVEVLQRCIADDSFQCIQIFFPDPWPKKKHHKRRLLQPAFVDLLAKKLAPGGLLHVATDWQHYAEHILSVLEQAPNLHNAAGSGNDYPRPDWRPLTKFELRGKRLGHQVFDLLFIRL